MGGGGEINTKIMYNIRDTLALRYSKSVDSWLGEFVLYNYRMSELCVCRIVAYKNDTFLDFRFRFFRFRFLISVSVFSVSVFSVSVSWFPGIKSAGLKTTVQKFGLFLSFNFMAMSVRFFTEYWSYNRWYCVSACKTISFFRDPNGLFIRFISTLAYVICCITHILCKMIT